MLNLLGEIWKVTPDPEKRQSDRAPTLSVVSQSDESVDGPQTRTSLVLLVVLLQCTANSEG